MLWLGQMLGAEYCVVGHAAAAARGGRGVPGAVFILCLCLSQRGSVVGVGVKVAGIAAQLASATVRGGGAATGAVWLDYDPFPDVCAVLFPRRLCRPP